MTEIDRPEVTRAFNEYIEPYDMTDDKIRLKAGHTYRVAGLSHRIAEDIGLSGEDVDLAWLIGVLHDIGRFEQLRRYNTFSDADSIDHAEFGADLLFKEGLIDRFYKGTAEEKDLIETAIRMHNSFELPEDLTEREFLFSTILRDADKVDIFRVNTEFPLPVIYNTTDELLRTSKLTPEVTEASNSHITVLKAIRKTPLDVIVGHMSLAYGLVYPVSYRITMEQGYLEQLMGFRTEDPDTNRELEKITSEIRGWMESHSR